MAVPCAIADKVALDVPDVHSPHSTRRQRPLGLGVRGCAWAPNLAPPSSPVVFSPQASPRHTTKHYAHRLDSYARSHHAVPSCPVRGLPSERVRSDHMPFRTRPLASLSNISSRAISDILSRGGMRQALASSQPSPHSYASSPPEHNPPLSLSSSPPCSPCCRRLDDTLFPSRITSHPPHIHAGIEIIDRYVTMDQHTTPDGCAREDGTVYPPLSCSNYLSIYRMSRWRRGSELGERARRPNMLLPCWSRTFLSNGPRGFRGHRCLPVT
ncbi:hypothetical protein BV22DRAFT_898944 [Leucogyrophana mollusca]|uniref:Uncharacterized protein n=1 Tax=Leucogyrophana mollusca TaxID=85980 RepID=A0ACB8B0I8_9AGAM|nr:hypothetical protein BV22DRAFT_898944 [Leucogyrophana mollusca]